MRRTLIGEVGQLHREAGFTLLEMIVVLAIMAMAIAFATSSISNSGGAVRLQPLAVRVAADLKLARADAISQNHPVEVEFDAKAHRAWLRETWGERVFSAAEVDEMRAFETGESWPHFPSQVSAKTLPR